MPSIVRKLLLAVSHLAMLGIGFALGNWLSLIVLVGTVLAVYAYRVEVEERALASVMAASLSLLPPPLHEGQLLPEPPP